MSKLDDQLEDLKIKKLKVIFLQLIRAAVGNVADDKFKAVEKEVKDQVFAFIDSQVDMIESGEYKSNLEIKKLFNDEEVIVLKKLVERAKNSSTTKIDVTLKPNNGSPGAPVTTPIRNTQPQELSKPDKIAFAIQHRSLGGQTVTLPSHGNKSGKVVGIDAPYIIVNVGPKQNLSVLPEELVL